MPSLKDGDIWTQEKCDQVFEASLAKYEGYVTLGTGGRAMLWTVVLLAAGLPLYAYTRWRNHAATSAAWRSP